jgi:GAF domain-containing protein/HAMP domain-containing protein
MLDRTPPPPSSLLNNLLSRTGGLFILITIALTQLITFPGAILGAIVLELNADFSPSQLNAITTSGLNSIIIGNIILLVGVYFYTHEASNRLTAWARGEKLSQNVPEELKGWRQITSVTWRYGQAAMAVAVFVEILPQLAYQHFVLGATNEQLIYSFFAGIVSAITIVALAILIIERALMPAREVLIPKRSETQLAGAIGNRLYIKQLSLTLALIVFSILLIAPVGYHQTIRALYHYEENDVILNRLQTEFIVMSIVALVLGFGLIFLLSRSVTEPIREMIKLFDQVEQGYLSTRARVSATDEIGELAIYFNRMVNQMEQLQVNLENQVAERTAQLKATIEVGRIASSILDPEELISQIVNLIIDRFGYYYAAVFTVDTTGIWAELKEGTGNAGRTLKTQHYRLQVGGKNVVGSAIANRQVRIGINVEAEMSRSSNPLLPETRSEIAIPLIVGERVLGALLVHSKDETAFGEQDTDTLQNMANQIAIALENGRLFQETRENLEEIRAIHAQYATSAWSDKVRTTDMQVTLEQPGLTIPQEEIKSVSVPITLREQLLGHIELQVGSDWSPEDASWVEAVATQAAITLDNARLIEESQQGALRDRLAAAITERIWSSTSIDGIMQTTIRELGRALEASEAAIELSVEE